jgi:hypothetical protein
VFRIRQIELPTVDALVFIDRGKLPDGPVLGSYDLQVTRLIGVGRAALLDLSTWGQLRKPLVGIRHWTWPGKVTRFQFADLKSRRHNKFINLAIEVAATSYSPPHRREPALPGDHAGIRSTPVLDKEETTSCFENPVDKTVL